MEEVVSEGKGLRGKRGVSSTTRKAIEFNNPETSRNGTVKKENQGGRQWMNLAGRTRGSRVS